MIRPFKLKQYSKHSPQESLSWLHRLANMIKCSVITIKKAEAVEGFKFLIAELFLSSYKETQREPQSREGAHAAE